MAEFPLTVNREGDTVEAILPMPLPYHPVPAALSANLSAIVIVPVYLICSAIYRKLRGIKPPPRARFVICPGTFRMEFVSRETGERIKFECDPASIIELRKNQYSRGLYVHVHGKTMHTFMEDFSDEAVISIAAQVRDLLNSTLKLSIEVIVGPVVPARRGV